MDRPGRSKNLKQFRMGPNQRAAAGAIKFVSAGIVVAVVLYCEIMYLGVVSTAFPDGIFRGLAIIGAVASGLSVLTLILGKMYWFPPGGQMIFGWLFTAAEVIVLILNLLLSFEIAWHHMDAWMATWRDFSPATPVIALVGWVVIWQLDSSTKTRHALIEQEQAEVESELEYRGQVHVAVMDLKNSYLAQTVENLKYEFSSAEVQSALRQGARDLAGSVLSEFTNIPVTPRPAAPQRLARTVESDPLPGLPQPPAQAYAERQDERGDQGQGGGGILGALIDGAKNAFSGGAPAAEPEPEPAVPVPVRRGPVGGAADRRRRRLERLRGSRSVPAPSAPVIEPASEPVPMPEPGGAGSDGGRKRKVKKMPGK